MLYQPEAFEPLTDEPWREAQVRDAIREIVADVDAALRGPKLLWPAHQWDSWRATRPMKNLYAGAAGVLFALEQLQRRGHAETWLDLDDLALRNVEAFRSRPDFMKFTLPEPKESSLFFGEAGILLLAYRLAPSAWLADDLHRLVRANVANQADEVMWGTPGTLIVARAMLEWTGDERWRTAWHESADALWSRRGEDGLWLQRLHGQEVRYLGPAHGLVGNVHTLVQLLDRARRTQLEQETAGILERMAFVEGGLANWPPVDSLELASPNGTLRVQWCHGAPGVIHAAGTYLDEELMLAGAELIWRAGPHGPDKGASICHGTAGNGYALLKTFEETGEERWLERAQRFAVHALDQVVRLRAERGRGRYSLWTGDLGVALFASDCLDGRSRYPFFDFDWLA